MNNNSDCIRRCHKSQLYRMVELMSPGRIVDVMVVTGTNNVCRSSDSVETQREAILFYVFTTVSKN